jgi:hypothetical protein
MGQADAQGAKLITYGFDDAARIDVDKLPAGR